jgi:hydroxymethylbilane synthase
VNTVRILSRSSALAVAQAREAAAALSERWPELEIEFRTRLAAGDRNGQIPLAQGGDKGLFTADLSDALVSGDADLVVHSWKDLPVEARPETMVAGTLPRADVRDVLLVSARAAERQPRSLAVLTSSPRRAWQMRSDLAPLLPWPVAEIHPADVRGNVPTRIEKLVDGHLDALVVAKAALDRLLGLESGADARESVRRALDQCRWMVLPVSRFPAAPAQGALAIEVAAENAHVLDMVRGISHEPTARACRAERAILASHGGGCHQAFGVTVMHRPYGTLTSVRGRAPGGEMLSRWSLERSSDPPPRAPIAALWPRPDERGRSRRRRLSPGDASPRMDGDLWITRAEAWPDGATPASGGVVWAAGITTWQKVAARGIWVNGCADGLGDDEDPAIEYLAGRALAWRRLTHTRGGDPTATATYEVTHAWPSDLDARTHFFWTSGSAFLEALDRFPAIRGGWHGSGPGRTARVIAEALETPERASIWLDYDAWLSTLTR